MTQHEAIFKSIEQIGDQTNLFDLMRHAAFYYGGHVPYDRCCKVRKEWQRKNNRKKDCRTYYGQPRRNMHNDLQWNAKQCRQVTSVFAKNKASIRDVANMVRTLKCHSVEQLQNLLDDLAEVSELKFAA